MRDYRCMHINVFFPLIFEKANVPLWYTYGSFIVLLTSALLGYFINYRQIVLTADQKEYMITWNLQGGRAVKVFLQILAIYYLDDGYVYWMILELVVSVAMAVALDKLLKRTYPWLKSIPSKGGKLRKNIRKSFRKRNRCFSSNSWCRIDSNKSLNNLCLCVIDFGSYLW